VLGLGFSGCGCCTVRVFHHGFAVLGLSGCGCCMVPVFTLDSAVLGLGFSGCGCCTVRVFHHGFCCIRVRVIGLRLLYGARFHPGFCRVRVRVIGLRLLYGTRFHPGFCRVRVRVIGLRLLYGARLSKNRCQWLTGHNTEGSHRLTINPSRKLTINSATALMTSQHRRRSPFDNESFQETTSALLHKIAARVRKIHSSYGARFPPWILLC
jgi:hypothetical protein